MKNSINRNYEGLILIGERRKTKLLDKYGCQIYQNLIINEVNGMINSQNKQQMKII